MYPAPDMRGSLPPLRPIGAVVRELREELGLTQEAVAEALEVDQAAWSKRERGVTRFNPEELVRLEDTFGMLRGTIYRRAGYVEDPAGPLEQIAAWTFLDPRWRDAIRRMVEPELPEDPGRALA